MSKGHPRFLQLLDQIRDTHVKKGSDYSSETDILSNLRVCEQFGVPAWLGALTRLSDKFERLKQLANKRQRGQGPAVKDESMADTLVDAASYSLLTLILLEEEGAVPHNPEAPPKCRGCEPRVKGSSAQPHDKWCYLA